MTNNPVLFTSFSNKCIGRKIWIQAITGDLARQNNNGSLLAEVMGPGTGGPSLLIEREQKGQSRFQSGKIGDVVLWDKESLSHQDRLITGPKI